MARREEVRGRGRGGGVGRGILGGAAMGFVCGHDGLFLVKVLWAWTSEWVSTVAVADLIWGVQD